MSTDTERRELIRPDATIAYWVSGPERAPVVLLLHGATLDHRAWDAQVDELTPQYRVVVPDLRGHGESTLEGAFRFDDAVDDVVALLDEVDTGTPMVVGGLSLGGNVAQEIVHRDPDRVDALVVADSTCNTAPRHPLAAPLTIATLAAMALGNRARFMQNAAAVTARRRAPLRAGRQRGPHRDRGRADPRLAAGGRPAPRAGLPAAGADPATGRRRRPDRRHRHGCRGVGGARPHG